ncbi:hypothetical protein SDRG_03101 [Saprolegnia diclina VS20]|uniref:SAM domain-containing protein n=1 Tax=Saprolegnia diclina (strain VS20) TaxID=1156394 RepID=T0SA53_SAPDV|nr:hypothetical protein SDRG_03101 [Saprolegnia diclina VS20]EQC39672.1 hypothetical protein SDRG_03101 [Saprolegnia diclina VS20]|eukprot:XP_008606944.1 hypothetical protein SDRG_03101 [Saprolegnia diclina VS20]
MDRPLHHITRDEVPTVDLDEARTSRSWEWVLLAAAKEPELPLQVLDTAFVHHGEVTAWYFTAKDGLLLRKSAKHLTLALFAQACVKIALAYEKNVAAHAAVVWRDGVVDCQLLSTNDLAVTLEGLPKGSLVIHAYVQPKGDVHPARFATYEYDHSLTKTGKAQAKCTRFALGAQRIVSKDASLNAAMGSATMTLLGAVEKHRKCRVVAATLYFVVDDAGYLFLVKTATCMTTPLAQSKPKKAEAQSSSAILGTTQRMLLRAQLDDLNAPDEAAVQAILHPTSKKATLKQGRLASLPKQTSSTMRASSPINNNHIAGGKLLSRMERRAISAANLGSSQKKGCVGDFCHIVVDPAARIQRGSTPSLLGFPKGNKSLAARAAKYEKKAQTFMESLEAAGASKMESGDSDIWASLTTPNVAPDSKPHTIPFKYIAQTRVEKDHVDHYIRRYVNGDDVEYIGELYDDGGDGEPLGTVFPGYYYQDVDVCANCFALYTLIEEARVKAKSRAAAKTKRKRARIPENMTSKAPPALAVAAWEAAWADAVSVASSISLFEIAELRSFAHPPPAIAMVASVLLILLLKQPNISLVSDLNDDGHDVHRYWSLLKRELAHSDKLHARLLHVHVSDFSADQVRRAQRYTANPLYRADVIEPIWKGAAKLCTWTLEALRAYHLWQPTKATCSLQPPLEAPPPTVDTNGTLRALTQNKQMARLAGARLEPEADPNRQHEFTCDDGVTTIMYQVLGLGSVALSKANLVVWPDFFDTLEATRVFLRSVLAAHPGCQMLVFNLPGQANTKCNESALTNLFVTRCVHELLTSLNASGMFSTSVPFHLVGFGHGGHLAACFAIQFGAMYAPRLQSVALINGFAAIDTQLAGILHGAVNLFQCLPHTRPDLPVSYFSKFLFCAEYLQRVDPNLALSIYTAVTNPISLEGRLRICKGALHNVDLTTQLSVISVPIVVVQSVENALVAPTNVDPFLQGRSCVHVWSHQQGKNGELNDRGRQLLVQALSAPEKSAFVTWLRAGHEVRQEAKHYICDLLEVLVNWPASRPEVPADVAFVASSAAAEVLSAPRSVSPLPEQTTESSPEKPNARRTLFRGPSLQSMPTIAPPPLVPLQVTAAEVLASEHDTTLYYENEANAAKQRLDEQIKLAELNAQRRREQEKAETEARLAALRLEQDRRRKQWEDEDNARLAALDAELQARHGARSQVRDAVQDALWAADVQVAESLEATGSPIPSVSIPDDLVVDVAPGAPSRRLELRETLLAAHEVPVITSLFDELEAEEEKNRKLGLLKVEEYAHVQQQMALAQAERQKQADHERTQALLVLHVAKAITIQTYVRRFLAQCTLRHLRDEHQRRLRRARAGAEIVRVARGGLSRMRTRAYKARKLELEQYLASTQLVQRWYRGERARKVYVTKRRLKYAGLLQRAYRGHLGRRKAKAIRDSQAYVRMLHAKATKLQATYKMYREKAKFLRVRVRTLAANELQRVFRGYLARKRVARMHEWDRAEPGPEKLSLGLQRIEASKVEFERQQKEIDALHRAQASAERKVSEIHASLTDAQKELSVLERELQEIDQIETDLHELTHEAEMLKARGGVEHADRQGLGNGIVLNDPSSNGGFETKEEARQRMADAYALEMAIHIKRNEREKKKKELEAEFTSVFHDVQLKKQALEEMEAKLSDMEATRLRKDREFARMQRNLMELLEEQKYELDMIREKGIELETATATSAAAAAATAMKAKEHEKKSQAIFESTEELMKFQFMSMSLSYFSSLNMLKSLRDINADTTAAAISSTAETAATAAAAAAAANIPTMQRLQIGSNELMDAASKKKKLELLERTKREDEAKAALQQPFPNAMRDWSIDDVQRWLEVLSLSQYKQAFREGAVDGALLLELRPEDLSDILGVTHKAHLLKILVSRKKYLPLSQQDKVKVDVVEKEDAAAKTRKGVPSADTVFSQARNGRLKRLMESVEAGFDINVEDEKGNTLLLIAAQNVNQKMVEFLVLRGANINHKNAQGNTALHFAMAYDKDGVLGEYLIGHGADDTIENAFGLSPYDGLSAD